MEIKKKRQKALKILETAIKEIEDLKISFSFISSIFFFNKKFDATDESRFYCTNGNYEPGDGEVFQTHAECLLDDIKKINKENGTK